MTVDEGVGVITISSPEVKNGLTTDMCLQLIEHWVTRGTLEVSQLESKQSDQE